MDGAEVSFNFFEYLLGSKVERIVRREVEKLAALPIGELFDKYWSYRQFRLVHGRKPSPDSMRFNDYLYRMKTSRTLDHPLRVFVTDKEYGKLFVKAVVGDFMSFLPWRSSERRRR